MIMTHTLKLFNTGQITLPKVWRSKFNTKNFIAVETADWLLITPLLDDRQDDIVYYENKDGFWIYSKEGIDPDVVISSLNALHAHG